MVKHLFLIILFAAAGFAQSAFAANGFWLEKKDGSKIGYLFDEVISVNYTMKGVEVKTSYATMEHAFDDVKKVWFDEGVTTGIEENTLSALQQQIRVSANGVEIKGIAPATPVSVSNLSGQILMQRTTDAQGSLYIGKSEMPQGIYIIKVGKTAIKFNN